MVSFKKKLTVKGIHLSQFFLGIGVHSIPTPNRFGCIINTQTMTSNLYGCHGPIIINIRLKKNVVYRRHRYHTQYPYSWHSKYKLDVDGYGTQSSQVFGVGIEYTPKTIVCHECAYLVYTHTRYSESRYLRF